MKKVLNPHLLFAFSMAIFGTIPLFVRKISVSSPELALYRAILAVLLIGVFLLIRKQKIELRKIKKEIILLLFSGTSVGVNWILLFEAYKYTTVSVATLSYYFAPVIVTVVSPIILKEKITFKQILCFVFSTIGLVLITGIGNVGGKSGLIGVALGLSAAVFYATAVLLNKFIKNVDGIQRTFLQFVAAAVVLLPYVLLTSGISVINLDARSLLNLLIVGFIHTGVCYCIYFSSLNELPGQKAAILSYIDPLVAVFISVTFLGENITIIQVIGGAMILGFTLVDCINLKRRR